MNEDLRERCRRFLETPPPGDLGYVGDSIAERGIRLYAAGQPPDGELAELLEIAAADSRGVADGMGGPAAEYLRASADLIDAIVADAS